MVWASYPSHGKHDLPPLPYVPAKVVLRDLHVYHDASWSGGKGIAAPVERDLQDDTSLQKWFYAIYMFTTTRHGVAAKELQRQLSVTYKTAWRMAHQIRKLMADADGERPLGGSVEADETYCGGKAEGR